MRSKGHSHNKLVRFVTFPLKVLGKARDVYVKSLTSCASSVSVGHNSVGCGQYSGLPRTFSTSSTTSSISNEDFKELVRAASVRSLGHRNEIEMLMQQQLMRQMESKRLPKSSSVGMGKIDEDKPCDFEQEKENEKGVKKKKNILYPRSKSYAVCKGSVLF